MTHVLFNDSIPAKTCPFRCRHAGQDWRGRTETDMAQSSVIQLQVEKVGQLFDTLDPTPFRERDLDLEAEEYIVGWARELPRKTAIRIVIHMPACEASNVQAELLGQAVNRYFGHRADMLTNELKE